MLMCSTPSKESKCRRCRAYSVYVGQVPPTLLGSGIYIVLVVILNFPSLWLPNFIPSVPCHYRIKRKPIPRLIRPKPFVRAFWSVTETASFVMVGVPPPLIELFELALELELELEPLLACFTMKSTADVPLSWT